MPGDALTPSIFRTERIVDPSGRTIPTSGITSQQIQRSIYQLLAENVLCSMASITMEGRAHINTAYFAYSPDLKVYFISHPNALHCQNIKSNPSMALAIYSSSQTWGNPDRGLQLFGVCKKTIGRERNKIEEIYGKRFAEYAAWKASLLPDSLGRDYLFYRFIPAELKVFDEKEFGVGVFVVARVRNKIGATFHKLK